MISLHDWCKEQNKEYLLEEWDYSKNIDTPDDVSYASNRRVYWRCTKGHQWEAMIANRSIRERRCPYCSHRKPVVGETDLATLYPEISMEWNYERNYPLVPENVAPHSSQEVWWKLLTLYI